MVEIWPVALWAHFLATASKGLSQQNMSVGGQAIGEVLAIATIEIPYMHIMLRSQYLQDDAHNEYIHWFMRNGNLPFTVSRYNSSDSSQIQRLKITAASKIEVANRDSFMIVTSTQELRLIAGALMQRAGSFFFVLPNESHPDMPELHNVLEDMWTRYSAFKNYVLTRDGVFIYDPFHFDTRQKRYGRVVLYNGKEPLERVLFSDMRGYPLRLQLFRSVYSRPIFDKNGKVQGVDGVDGEVASLLQRRLNFTMDLQDPDPDYFGERDSNGNFNGAIGSIIRNEIDLCLTGFFVKDYMAPEMDFTVAVYDDQLCIYVPKAKRIPQSILPILSVRYDLWLGFLLTAFICAFIWVILRRFNLWLNIISCDRRPLDANFVMQSLRIYIDTWVLWVRVNLVRYPPFYSERIFIASLCLVSVIFGAIFESSLATVYIHPMYYKDINSLQELDESNLRIIYKYASMADDLFFSETSPLFASLNKKLTFLGDYHADVIRDIAYIGGKAGVTRYTSLMLESLHFIIAKRVWVVPECPKYYTISYVMPKDSPWEEAINNLLLLFQSNGLIKKWIGNMQTAVDIKVMKMQDIAASDTFKVLTISDLQLAFYVVMLGSLLSACSLLGEYYLKSCRCRQHKQHGLQTANINS